MEKEEIAFIGLGSNEGDRTSFIADAVDRIRGLPGIRVLVLSPLYETAPVGVSGDPFINAVIMVETGVGPHRLLGSLLGIEVRMGRVRSGPRPGPRSIDLDILLYGDRAIREQGLIIPHPRMADRRFVLEPLSRIAPDLRIPLSDRTVAEAARLLRNRCPEQGIRMIGDLEKIRGNRAEGGMKVLP